MSQSPPLSEWEARFQNKMDKLAAELRADCHALRTTWWVCVAALAVLIVATKVLSHLWFGLPPLLVTARSGRASPRTWASRRSASGPHIAPFRPQGKIARRGIWAVTLGLPQSGISSHACCRAAGGEVDLSGGKPAKPLHEALEAAPSGGRSLVGRDTKSIKRCSGG